MAIIFGTIEVRSRFSEQVSFPAGNSAFNRSFPDFSRSLGANSTPDITQAYIETLALSTGALTVDLSNLTRTGESALDLTGLAIHGLLIMPLGANDMTIVETASTGFTGIVPPTTTTPLKAGEIFVRYSDTSYGTVGASNKDFSLTGTGSETFHIQVLAGAAA